MTPRQAPSRAELLRELQALVEECEREVAARPGAADETGPASPGPDAWRSFQPEPRQEPRDPRTAAAPGKSPMQLRFDAARGKKGRGT